MFSRALKTVVPLVVQNRAKNFSTTYQNKYKVVVAGGAGGAGQALCLLFKMNPLVTHLAVYDIAPMTPGVAVDLSHMNTPTAVTGHKGLEQLDCAMECADVVVITGGFPRKDSSKTRDDLFKSNAPIIRELSCAIARKCPCALVLIVTNPVNVMVPLMSEILKTIGSGSVHKVLHEHLRVRRIVTRWVPHNLTEAQKQQGCYDPRRIFGVTTLDVVRAATFVGAINCIDPRCVDVPLIGGHSARTILALLSQSRPPVNLCDPRQLKALYIRIQEAGSEIVNAKAGAGSCTLTMAYAAHRLAHSCMRGLNGEANVIECSYVRSNVHPDVNYFASPLLLGRCGIEKIFGYGKLNEMETELLKIAIPHLKENIKTGENYLKT